MAAADGVYSQLPGEEYPQGFVTEIAHDTLPPGLDEGVIRTLSARKGEPSWLLAWRLKAYRRWLTMEDPEWAQLHHPEIDFQAISY